METVFIQISKNELTQLINDAVRSALPEGLKTEAPQPFIRGIHELAAFLKTSAPRAQKLKNEGVFPYWQDGRTLLFDPIKVREAMQSVAPQRKRKSSIQAASK